MRTQTNGQKSQGKKIAATPRAAFRAKRSLRAGARTQETRLLRGSSERAGSARKFDPVRAVVPLLTPGGCAAYLQRPLHTRMSTVGGDTGEEERGPPGRIS